MLGLIDNLGGSEFLIVMVAALLVFGKKLPRVAGEAAKQIVKLRRSLDGAWRDTGMQQEIQAVKRDLESALPRDLSIGEMARLASDEMDKRIRVNDEALQREAKAERTPEPPPERPVARGSAEGFGGERAPPAATPRPEAGTPDPRTAEPSTSEAKAKLVDFS
jgi:Sec-independent protein translocase protein TatA